MRILLAVSLMLFAGCNCNPDCTSMTCEVDGGDAGPGQTDAGPGPGFDLIDLDATALEATSLAMAIDRTQGRVGVAYFTNAGTQTMPGVPDYALKYVEWRQGVASTPQTIRVVQRLAGLSLGFDPVTGEPVAAYLGGGADTSVFWFQSDAVLNRRSNGTTWTETAVSTRGDQIICGNVVSDRGFLVGLWPSFAWDSTGKLYFVSRDAHGGQSGVQDWEGSDVELWEGSYPPATGTCLASGGGVGGHNQLIIGAGDQPALIYDTMITGPDVLGTNVVFQRRTAAGTWTGSGVLLAVSNTQTGASLAWDATEGYGIAAVDRANNELKYVSSQDGVTWTTTDSVFGAGTGGWFPSLAMDPVRHEPAIAFAVCSGRSGVNETGCPAASDELRVTQRTGTRWNETVVDVGGAWFPKLGFFASGKRVIAYRSPPTLENPVTNVGKLKLAVER